MALPVPLRMTFTYAVPVHLCTQLQVGCRVLVPFRKKSLIGVVTELLENAPAGPKIREISKVVDLLPALTPKLIELGQWISGYYLAPVGEVFRGMLPPVREFVSRREIILTEAGGLLAADLGAPKTLPELSQAQIEFLHKLREKKGAMLLAQAARLGITLEEVQRMQKRGLLEIRVLMRGRKRKTHNIIAWRAAEDRTAELDPKQERIRMLLEAERGPLPLPQLLKLAQVSRGLIERMRRDGLLESWEESIDPAEEPFEVGYTPPAHSLNDAQERVFSAIRERFELGEFGVQLLHGVTGSGKTEVYLRSVQDTLARGKTALVLVPEIALTLWIGRQCRAWFGARFEGVAVLHSALSDVERAGEWWRVRNGEARVVVGTRSAVFAPLENVGLIIVDEEQENSYKQEEAPRYHGRDVAIVRAKLENALALLGSATPSLETYHHAVNGKYELLTMATRVENRSMASVEIVDLRTEFQQTQLTSPISKKLHDGITEALSSQTQALVLINRRGYSW